MRCLSIFHSTIRTKQIACQPFVIQCFRLSIRRLCTEWTRAEIHTRFRIHGFPSRLWDAREMRCRISIILDYWRQLPNFGCDKRY